MKKLPQIRDEFEAIFLCYISVTAASAVVLIAATVVVLIVASVVTCENKDEDDEENPVAVASVTKEHLINPLSHLPLHIM